MRLRVEKISVDEPGKQHQHCHKGFSKFTKIACPWKQI